MIVTEAILYVPSDTPEAMTMATRRVAGVPVIVRGVMTLRQSGLERITLLIAESQRERIERFLTRYPAKQLPEIDYVCYDEPYRVSPDTICTVAKALGDRLLIINANLLFESELVRAMQAKRVEIGELVMAREGMLPLPVFGVRRRDFLKLESFTAERPRSVESCLKYLFENLKQIEVQKPATVNTFLVRRMRDRAVAEKHLTESIRHSTSGPVAKFINKRFSLPASLLLAKLWVSPNTITACNIVIGVFSGVFVADGHRYDAILFGAILFQIASIVDGCDGEVAKLTFRASKFGQYIDSVSDNLSLASFMVGLIAGYWRHTHSFLAFTIGAIMVAGTCVTFFWMIRFLKQNTESASLVTFDKEYLQKLSSQPRWLMTLIKYGKFTLKKDVFSFMFLLFAIAGVLYWWLFIAAFGTTVSALILTYLNLQSVFKRNLETQGESA